VREMTSGLSIEASVTARMSWDYGDGSSRYRPLYEKAKLAQWNAATDIDWSPELSFGAPLADSADGGLPARLVTDGPVPPELWNQFRWEFQTWMTSQFLHGEQGALVATSRLVETIPDAEAKLYAASQVIDEARHVEAYTLYLRKLGQSYPVNASLSTLLENVISDSRWDVIYLGLQIIIEGLAVAAFRLGSSSFSDPIIRQITQNVARDESRHVAFGMLALDGYYEQLTSREIAEREELIKESTLLMSRRFLLADVWERLGIDVSAGTAYAASDPSMLQFRRLLFAKVVSSVSRLGLMTPGLRQHLQELRLVNSQGN
jgi:Long-chain fatty aldehyde decarbonylase